MCEIFVSLQVMDNFGVELMAPVQDTRTEGVVHRGIELSFIDNSSSFSINKLLFHLCSILSLPEQC